MKKFQNILFKKKQKKKKNSQKMTLTRVNVLKISNSFIPFCVILSNLIPKSFGKSCGGTIFIYQDTFYGISHNQRSCELWGWAPFIKASFGTAALIILL